MLTVNSATHTVDVEPATPLLYVLRNDLGLRGSRFRLWTPRRWRRQSGP